MVKGQKAVTAQKGSTEELIDLINYMK